MITEDDNDKIVNLLQRQQARRWQDIEDYMREKGQTKQQLLSELFETLVGFARRQNKHEWRVDDELEVLITLLVLYAGNAKVSGLSLVKRLCKEIDMCAAECWTADFADWFEAGVPQELMDYEDFEYLPARQSKGRTMRSTAASRTGVPSSREQKTNARQR